MTSLVVLLRLNAASCLGFGSLFTVHPGPVATTLGNVPPVVIVGLGLALLLNGLHLWIASMRPKLWPAEIMWFSLGDLAWWLGTMTLLSAGVWVTTPLGIALGIIVAISVAGLGVAQLFLRGMELSGLTAPEHWQRIGQSWLALPNWVKKWLFALNAVFLAVPAFLPWNLASTVLIGYAASGPMLLGFAGYAGGLTRLMGIAHLVPWTPLLVWLVMQMALTQLTAPTFGFSGLLVLMLAVCLGFDLYDLARWVRGERSILALPTKVTTGTSD